MKTEYEATFYPIDRDNIRKRLKNSGAKLIKPEFMQKRVVFNLPKGHEIPGGWLRVRDEGDKITMSLKIVSGNKITDQKESMIIVDDFGNACLFLKSIGCIRKAFQESKRELWHLYDCEITIDEWLFLEPFVEIEGSCESDVKKAAEKLGFDYKNALFCSVDTLYNMKFKVPCSVINNNIPEILFNGNNPFLKV